MKGMKKAIVMFAVLIAVVASAFAKCLVVGLVDVCAPGAAPRVPKAYPTAFAAQGAKTHLIKWSDDPAKIRKAVESVDLVLMCGGEDVKPSRYGEKDIPQLGKVNERRDEFEFAVLTAATNLNKRIFGICRGLQIINVFYGGTLYQDYASQLKVRKHPPEHEITIKDGTFLKRIWGTSNIKVNSSHHQSVKDLAPGFSVVANGPDGVVEAIADEKRGVFAVQFHPERLFAKDAEWGRLFSWLLK